MDRNKNNTMKHNPGVKRLEKALILSIQGATLYNSCFLTQPLKIFIKTIASVWKL